MSLGQSNSTGVNPITDNLDLWSSATKKRATVGRGKNGKTSPHGINKLRELILELAVRGKLVSQDPSDEPASVLLETIEAKKSRLIEEGKIRKPTSLPPINDEEKLFETPANWDVGRFGALLDFSGGSQPPKSNFSEVQLDGYVQLIQIRDLGPNPQPVYVPREKVSKFCTSDDVMIGRYGASVGKVFWGKGGAYNVALIKLHNDFGAYIKEFLYLLMLSPLGQKLFSGISRSAQAGFSKKDIEVNLLPILSHSEQHRIVAKVDELMTLCDQLEQQQTDSLHAHQTLVRVFLGRMVDNANTRQPIHTELIAAFDTLFTTEEAIDQLKQTILQLAVMGKLVPQNPNDEPASLLLEKIAAEKEQLIKDKKIKKQKPLPLISDEEKPFELPVGWEWARIDDLSFYSEAGWSPKCKATPKEANNWGVLKVSAVTWGIYNPDENKELPENLEPKPEYEVRPGDFLISRANTADLVARAVVVPDDAPPQLMMSDKLIRVVFSSNVNREFIKLVNSSAFSRSYYARVAGGTSSSMKNVSRNQIRNLIVAFPSLSEQHCIVAKVDELMTLCDTLKARLNEAQTTQAQLADAVVEQAVG